MRQVPRLLCSKYRPSAQLLNKPSPCHYVQRRYLGESKPEKSRISTTFDNFVNRQKTPETFEDFLKSVDEDNTKSREQRGLVNLDSSKYKNLLVVPDNEAGNEDQKVDILLSAMALYKQKEPRLRTDHAEFAQWMIKRMWDFELTHRVELYEELITLFPPFKYKAPGWIEKMMPKPSPGMYTVQQIIWMAQHNRVKPSFKMYRNVYRVFGKSHPICTKMRHYGWWYHIWKKANPYPLPDETYDFEKLKVEQDHLSLAKYVADRMMAQNVKYKEITSAEGEHIATQCVSQTQQDLATLQIPDDIMRMTGPHSIWCGRVQRWYWVLRREERGDEFEGAPLSIVVSPKKECQEAAQLMLKDMQNQYPGIAGSTILLEEPTEVLTLDPAEHHRDRKKFYGFKDMKDAIGETELSTITEPQYEEVLQREADKELSNTSKTFSKRSKNKRPVDDDDDW